MFLGVIAAGWLAASFFVADDPPVGVERPGGLAPEIQVTTFDGEMFVLSRHLGDDGRPVILNLWASWCIPCRTEMPELDRLAKNTPDVFVIGVAVDDTAVAARGLAAELGVDYPLAFDATGRVAEAYPSFGLPVTYFISSDGVITHRFQGAVTEGRLVEVLGL